MKKLIFLLVLVFANINVVYAYEEQELVNFAKSESWLAVLHYNRGSSIVTSPSFFYSPTGHKNPLSEAKAFLEAIKNEEQSRGDEHALCKFPARAKLIVLALNIDEKLLPKPNCTELNYHRTQLDAKSIAVVFASESLTVPSSMMGHMFFKIQGTKTSHAVAYLGVSDETLLSNVKLYLGSVFYRAKGLYALSPYNKTQDEYIFGEGRNLWSFTLDLTQEEVDLFVDNLWELKDMDIPYNFIHNNCVEGLFMLLAASKPQLYGIQNINTYNTPIDSIRILANKKMLLDGTVDLSTNTRLRLMEKDYSNEEISIVKKIIKTKSFTIIENEPQQEQEKIAKMVRVKENYASWTFDNNIKNIAYPVAPANILNRADPSQINFGVGSFENKTTYEFGFQPAYNKLMSNNSSYFGEYSLNLASLNIRGNDEKIWIYSFDLINIKSFMPHSAIAGGWTWNLNVGTEDGYPNVYGGLGQTYGFFSDTILIYGLINTGYKKYAYVTPELGLFFRQNNIAKLYVSTNLFKTQATQSIYINRNNSLDFSIANGKEKGTEFWLKYNVNF
jgi:hypothetical protein